MRALIPAAAGLVEIENRGFTVVPSVIAEAEVKILREALEIAIGEDFQRWGERDYVNANMVLNLMSRGADFVRLLDNDVLHAYLTPLLSDTCILYAYTSSSMPPSGTNYARRIHVDCPRFILGYATNIGITLALDDFTEENGATYMLPGSHRIREAPSEDDFNRGAERVLPRAGEAIIFNARTWHRGGVNRTNRYRHAVTMNVCRSYMRQQFDFPRMIDAGIVDKLGDRGRRFLGFDVRMPVSLDEYYRPPELRPYKPNQG
jgi:ectoine hydroxylase-related dioxygenase (phytanoyl-CoA dioxygenase family)